MPRAPDPAWVATTRFGLGARGGELRAARADPRGWLLAQLDQSADEAGLSTLSGTRDLLVQVGDVRREADPDTARREARQAAAAVLQAEAEARMRVAGTTTTPFRERWLRFWSNHFTVSAQRLLVTAFSGAFEREAIRPAVLGAFSELLLSVCRHPAMLVYLDNSSSIGPHSEAGLRRGKGLNENLAREILELHTLGVNGGYSQADVIALAQILTGWGVVRRPDKDQGRVGPFVFNRDRHEPGTKRLLGRDYVEQGELEGRAALRDLAAHPSTARFIATKLCRHFVHDTPPEAAVATLERRFLETGGDLHELAVAVVGLEAAWTSGGSKVKTPDELLISTARALQLGGDKAGSSGRWGERDWAATAVSECAALGQAAFQAPSPAGWSELARDWAGPGQVLRRVELAESVGRQARARVTDPLRWAGEVLGAELEGPLTEAIRGAPDTAAAITYVLASPAFQRR